MNDTEIELSSGARANILAIERSTEMTSVAFARKGTVVVERAFPGALFRNGDWPVKMRDALQEAGCSFDDAEAFLVGTGPGSFAGVRGALAFARGLAIPGNKRVLGLASPFAFTAKNEKRAVIGDARRDRYWVALFDGFEQAGGFVLCTKETLQSAVPEEWRTVMTPDGARIGELLSGIFGPRYKGNVVPLAGNLLHAALANPKVAQVDPKPVYLAPAVRDPQPPTQNP